MTKLKIFFSSFPLRMDLLFAVILASFTLMIHKVEEVQDMIYQDGRIFVAYGKHGIRVLDTKTTPGQPQEIGKYDTLGSTQALTTWVWKDKLHLLAADGTAGIGLFEVSPEGSLIHVWSYPKISQAIDIAVFKKYAFVAHGESGLTILKIDEGKPEDENIWVLEDSPGINFVRADQYQVYLVDQENQLHILEFNKDNPGQSTLGPPFQVGFPVNDLDVEEKIARLATSGGGLILLNMDADPSNAVIRQYKGVENILDIHADGDIAYISGGEEGIKALDITHQEKIVTLGSIKKVQTGAVPPNGITITDPNGEPILVEMNAQQIVGDSEYVYYADGVRGIQTLKIKNNIDVGLADVLGGLNNNESWAEDLVIIPNEPQDPNDSEKTYAYMAGGDRGLWIIDVSDPNHPDDLNYKIIPETEGTKILEGHVNAIAALGETIFLSYRDEGVQALDVSNPKELKAYPPFELDDDNKESMIFDLATLNGKLVFIAAGGEGLKVIDYTDKNNPRLLATEDAPGNSIRITANNKFAYLSAGEKGLHVFDITNEDIPTLVYTYDNNEDARALAFYSVKDDGDTNNYAYLADGENGVQVLSLKDPRQPFLFTDEHIDTPSQAQDVFVKDHFLYVTDKSAGLLVYNLKESFEKPTKLDTSETPGTPNRVTVEGDFAYVADQNRGLRIVKVKNKEDLQETGYFDMPTKIKDMILTPDNRYAYVVGDSIGMWTLELGDFKNPIPIHRLEIDGKPTSIEWARDANREAKDNRQAVIADGSRGFYLVDLSQPTQPKIISHYKDLKDVRRVIILEETAYVANGDGELSILSVEEPDDIEIKNTFGTNGAAMNINVAGEYIYIITSESKLDIGHIADNEGQEWKLERQPIKWDSEDPLEDTFSIDFDLMRNYGYVSDGVKGLVILNLSQPLKPQIVGRMDTPGTLKDVDVHQKFVFLADGSQGVDMFFNPKSWLFDPEAKVYYTFDPESPDYPRDCLADAQNIKAVPYVILDEKVGGEKVYTLHHFAYTATDQCGLLTLQYDASTKFTPVDLYPSPGEASFRMVVQGTSWVLKNTRDNVWRGGLTIKDVPRIARNAFIAHTRALDQRVQTAGAMYLFGVSFLILGLIFWLGFVSVSNFILPIRNLRSGINTFLHLFLYFRGYHGDITLAREARAITRSQRRGWPGFVLVDLNSAVVIDEVPLGCISDLSRYFTFRQRMRAGQSRLQSRVAGPGLVFLRRFERVRTVVDLRRQIRLRLKVKAFTRDGIEVLTNVFAGFTIGEDPEILKVTYDGPQVAENLVEVITREDWIEIPGNLDRQRRVEVVSRLGTNLDPVDQQEIHRYIQGLTDMEDQWTQDENERLGTPFIYDPDRVFKAGVSRPFDVEDQEIKDWTELPPHVAAGLFRDFISRDTYDHLFQPEHVSDYHLRDLKRDFADTMRNQGILSYQYVKKRDGKPIEVDLVWEKEQILFSPRQSLRNPKSLRARGIKIILAGFTELSSSHEDVQGQLTDYWRSEWEQEAGITRSDYDLQAMRVINYARKKAETDLVNTLGIIFQEGNFSRQALVYRVLQALETAATFPGMNTLVPHETIQMLGQIQKMLGNGEDE